MPFQAHPTYLAFEAANRPFAPRLRSFLETVGRDAATHARFLNTLSMMEHMGSRRIAITQNSPALEQETLKHMAEEARHAFFFKRQADRMAGRALDYSDAEMVAPAFARMYFKRLEAAIANELKTEADPLRATYLYMSMIVEFRAVWGFAIYQSVLERARSQLSLKSLLAEEQGHLEHMEAQLAETGSGGKAASGERTRRFLEIEHALFARLLDRLEAGIGRKADAA